MKKQLITLFLLVIITPSSPQATETALIYK